jgi:hypothetical protein
VSLQFWSHPHLPDRQFGVQWLVELSVLSLWPLSKGAHEQYYLPDTVCTLSRRASPCPSVASRITDQLDQISSLVSVKDSAWSCTAASRDQASRCLETGGIA